MKIYLIPVPLAADGVDHLPPIIRATLHGLDTFFVENERTARRFLSMMEHPRPIHELSITKVDKNVTKEEVGRLLKGLSAEKHVGVLSEAGCPAIADPGAYIVAQAHRLGTEVIPLTGPSSIFLALMAAGFNGQNFAFSGYLPIEKPERRQAILQLEQLSAKFGQTQVFMETPYRNNQLMQDLLAVLQPETSISVAVDLTSAQQLVRTKTCREWRNEKIDLHKRPCIFCLSAVPPVTFGKKGMHERKQKNKPRRKSK